MFPMRWKSLINFAWLVTTWYHVILSASGDQSRCMQSLLLNRDRIPATAITATSEQTDPTGVRRFSADSVRAESTDFAWCPSQRVGSELTEFVQVDMGELNVINKLVIGGLLAEGGGYRFSPYFYVRYKREWSESEWRTYRKFHPSETSQLVGSNVPLVPKFVVLDPPLIARWIRIYPYRDTPGFVCMRLEAYGCRFTDDLVEYQIPEGSLSVPGYLAPPPDPSTAMEPSPDNQTKYYRTGGGAAFSDRCYDGYRVEPGSLLDGGLGCLTDLSIAPQTAAPSPGRGQTSSDHVFVGWHRSRWHTEVSRRAPSLGAEDVVHMRFRFASTRRFQQVKLYASNNYLEKVRLPKRIEVRFSVGGVDFSRQPAITQEFLPDNQTNGVMSVELDLNNRIGQFVQLKVFFADDWLLLSEISFVSRPSSDQILPEDPPGVRHTTVPSISSSSTPVSAAEFLDLSGRIWPTVIVLALLIVVFVVIIGFTCTRLCWKRQAYWHAAGKPLRNPYQQSTDLLNRHRPLVDSVLSTDGLLHSNNQQPPANQVLINSDGTLIKPSPFSRSEFFGPTHDTTGRLQSNGGLLNRALISNHSPSSGDTASKPSAGPEFHPPSTRKTNRFIISALCPASTRKRSYSPSPQNSITGASHSDSGTRHSRSLPPSMDPSQPHSVRNIISGGGPPAGTFISLPPQTVHGDLSQFDFFTPPGMYPNGATTDGVSMDWRGVACSNQSTSHSNGAAFCPAAVAAAAAVALPNTEINLYTSVGGESDDMESNCASTMSPEYASTTPDWTTSLMRHHPSMRPRNSFLASTAPLSSSPRPMPQSVTLTRSSNHHNHNHHNNGTFTANTFAHTPFVYFNPGVPAGFVTTELNESGAPLYHQLPPLPFTDSTAMSAAYRLPSASMGGPVAVNGGTPTGQWSCTNLPPPPPSSVSNHVKRLTVWSTQPMANWKPQESTRGSSQQQQQHPQPDNSGYFSGPLGTGGFHSESPDSQNSNSGPWIRASRADVGDGYVVHSRPPVPSSLPPPPPPPPIDPSRPKLSNTNNR